DGKLRGRAVHLEGAGDYAAGTLRLDGLDAKSGRSELHASGTLADAADLAFSVDSPDLGDLWPGFAGKIAAHGSVKGPRSRPRVAVEAKGGAIRLPRAEIGDLLVDANVDLSGSAASNLALALEDASLAGTSITALKVDGSGNARAHSLTLVADTSVGKADVAVRGSVEAPWQPNAAWSFEVDKATLAYPSLAPWMLDGTATGRWSAGAAELERSCWHSGEARLCIDATDRQGGRHAGLTLTGLPLVYFRPLLSEPVAVEGDLTATAEIDLPKAGPPRIDVTLRTTPGRIGTAPAESSAVALTSSEPAVKESADPAAPSDAAAPAGVDASIFGASARPQGLAFGAADGRIVSDGEKATLDLALPFERQGHVDVHAVVERSPGRPLTASTLQGDAALEVRDLSFLPNVVPEVANTAGRIVGDVMLSGTLSSPRLSGSIALEDARADLIGPGVTVQDVRIVVKGDGSGALAVDAEAESGGGRLTAAGVLRLEGAAPVGEVHVSGERFQLYGTSDATVFVSPDLTLTATPSRLVVGGTVAVPSASITPQVIESGAVTPSPDQVIIGANGEAERRAMTRALYAAITLTLGDDVRFTGYGLTSRLGGRLNIRETPGEPTTASGEVRIEQGTYQAYGQRLEIRRGRLTFAGGPITRPGLDIEAVRQATETILVGARVRGTLAQPELSIFSEPPLPEQEQLAYLVLGRSLEDTSASESSALQSAAIALGLKGGNAVSERLNKNLGFQEFGIETKPGEGTTSASFVIGRYLSPSLYVSYGFGLFQPVNTLTLRYAISSRWRLVTESSSQAKGGDLFYHIERGE
ncbi:MAG TPA: translocation/assembly module TamB domain-containing protein, partial [Gammaproteobacteria bacterium]|nr:translocation/assembly module TamB domain-containing protein [Gammaproteobacteria bacterium]